MKEATEENFGCLFLSVPDGMGKLEGNFKLLTQC